MKIRDVNYSLAKTILLYSFVFIVFPGIDFAFTELLRNYAFYCKIFAEKIKTWLVYAATSLTCTYGILAFFGYIYKRKYLLNYLSKNYEKFTRDFVFLFFNLAIISGITIEIIKNIFHRPRPYTINTFGGENTYVQIWHIANSCITNCSFPSGDAAVGFSLFPITFVLTKNLKFSFLVGAIVGCMLSYCRIALAKHFLSDVLFSFILVYYFTLISRILIYNTRK